MPARHLELGRSGEEAAAGHMSGLGCKVLARNWRFGRLEIDLICRCKKTIVFVEVKTRGEGSLGSPADGLTPAKAKSLVRAASRWLSENDSWNQPCRFDLVSVTGEKGEFTVEHFADVIDAAQAVGRGNAAWQPF